MSQVFWLPTNGLGQSCLWLRPRGGEWLFDECSALQQQGVEVVISLLTAFEEKELDLQDESRCLRTLGMIHESWPLRDRGVPESMLAWTSRFEEFEKQHGNKVIAAHCRQGIGRSSLWLVAWRAWQGIPVQDSLAAIAELRGRSIPDTQEQIDWLLRWEQRLRMRE